MDEISELINNFENIVKYCNLIKYGNIEYEENDNKGMVIIQKYYLMILKFQDDENAEQIKKIKLNFIQKVEIKKKNYINIDILDEDQEKLTICLKFGTEQEAKKFLTEINRAAKLTDL